jgi:hypothetical protein
VPSGERPPALTSARRGQFVLSAARELAAAPHRERPPEINGKHPSGSYRVDGDPLGGW